MQPGAKEAAQRRAAAKQREAAVQMDRTAHFEALIQGRRLKNIGTLHL